MDFEERLNGCIERVGVDKVLHLMVGYGMVATGLMYSLAAGLWCLLAVIALSVVKEVAIDKQADWVDVLAGVAGGIVALMAYIPKDLIA